jgi:hypothetical protein
MIELNWDDVYNSIPGYENGGIKLGTLSLAWDEELDFGAPVGRVPLGKLLHGMTTHVHPSSDIALWQVMPQFALLVFMATQRVYALNSYFPLTSTLDKMGQRDFYRLAGDIMRQPGFRIWLVSWLKPAKTNVISATTNWREFKDLKPVLITDCLSRHVAKIAFFVACHIAEILYYRRDILERFLKTPFEIRLATSSEAFKQDGGVAGGNYDPERGRIQMMLSRLFEGYNGKSPGVAPFLHEFGHLLDHFDTAEGELGKSKGTLPGMRPEDSVLYNAEAHELFLKGKTLEWERYMKLSADGYREGDLFPIGHPYVFQNDTEFIAGYLEMFFRNPHYFAAQNPDLYEAFRLSFRQDPRQFWEADFPFYIQQNQTYYRGLQRPPKPRLTI